MDEIDYRNFHIIARLIIIDGVVKIILPDEKIRSKTLVLYHKNVVKYVKLSKERPLH